MNAANPRFTKKGKPQFDKNKPLVSCYKEINGRKYVADGADECSAEYNCASLLSDTRTGQKRGKGEFYEGLQQAAGFRIGGLYVHDKGKKNMKKSLTNHINEYLKIRSALVGIPLKTNKEILSSVLHEEFKSIKQKGK